MNCYTRTGVCFIQGTAAEQYPGMDPARLTAPSLSVKPPSLTPQD